MPGSTEGEPVETNAHPFRMEGASDRRMRDDLPVYGSALGAAREIDGEAIEQTTLNRAEIVQYAKRPVLLESNRSEEHTSELQSLMRTSYAVFCLKKKKYYEENKKQATK